MCERVREKERKREGTAATAKAAKSVHEARPPEITKYSATQNADVTVPHVVEEILEVTSIPERTALRAPKRRNRQVSDSEDELGARPILVTTPSSSWGLVWCNKERKKRGQWLQDTFLVTKKNAKQSLVLDRR